MQNAGKWKLIIVLSYHQVHPSTSVSSPQLFEACPPVPSCTSTLASVSPLDEAVKPENTDEHSSQVISRKYDVASYLTLIIVIGTREVS